MNYDEHFPGGTPGPVASQDWFTTNLNAAIKDIPKEKLICAIGNYGYDWVERAKKGKLPPGINDKSVSVQDAWIGSRETPKKISITTTTRLIRTSAISTTTICHHDVWFLDAVTALNEMRAAQTLGIQTFALWRLGSEDRSLWRVWDVPGEATAPDRLERRASRPGRRHGRRWRNPAYRGQAGRRRARHQHRQGQRSHRRRNLQDLCPEPYRVARYGASKNQTRHHLRRRSRSGMDSQDSRRPQAQARARRILS